MEGMGFTWSYQEQVDDLKQKILCTAMELEEFKLQVREVMGKHEEDLKQLIHVVDIITTQGSVYEAKNHVQNHLFTKYIPSNVNMINTFPNTFNYDHNPQISSLYDPFFHPVTPPPGFDIIGDDSSSIAAAYVNTVPMMAPQVDDKKMIMYGSCSNFFNQDNSVIDHLTQGKPLPQKGQLLKAVTDAGPLLQDLVVAGHVPNWRNPPQMDTTLMAIPPPPPPPSVQIKGSTSSAMNLDTIGPRLNKSMHSGDLCKWNSQSSGSSYYTLGKNKDCND